MIFRLDPPWIALLLPLPAVALAAWWDYQFSFPVLMEQLVRRGKSWLYFPALWTRNRAALRWINTAVQIVSGLSIGGAVWWSFFSGVPAAVVLAGLGIGVQLLLSRKIWVIRYQQQARLYYDRLTGRHRGFEESSTRESEIELRNIVSWEHQQLLHTADQEGKLLDLLSGDLSVEQKETSGRE